MIITLVLTLIALYATDFIISITTEILNFLIELL